MEPVSRIVSEDEWRRVQSHLDGGSAPTLNQLVQTEGKGTRQSCASYLFLMFVMARAYLMTYSRCMMWLLSHLFHSSVSWTGGTRED